MKGAEKSKACFDIRKEMIVEVGCGETCYNNNYYYCYVSQSCVWYVASVLIMQCNASFKKQM